MDIFYRFVSYVLIFLAGALILKYRKNVKYWSGEWVWAERYIGRGGTYTIIILFGLFLCFYAVTKPFGVWEFNWDSHIQITTKDK